MKQNIKEPDSRLLYVFTYVYSKEVRITCGALKRQGALIQGWYSGHCKEAGALNNIGQVKSKSMLRRIEANKGS